MAKIEKIKKTATVLVMAAGLVFLWFIFKTVKGVITNVAEWHLASVLTFSAGALILAAALALSISLLYTVKQDETPFIRKNVARLKIIAALLVALEPYMLIAQWVYNKYYPIVLADGISAEVHFSLGGSVFAAGLVVYCISLVFDYGIALQTQVDETL